MDRPSRVVQARQLLGRTRHPWRIEVDGLARLPDGAAVLAVNRVGPSDHLNVVASLGRPATVVIPPESGLRPTLGLRRTGWAVDLDSVDHPAAVLGRHHVLVVFPEGLPGNDGAVHKGHAEFVAAALASGAPIVPAALVPLARPAGEPPAPRMGRWQRILPEPRYRLRIGQPIAVDRYTDVEEPGDTVDGYILRGLADLVMTQISQLAGRRYCDRYTARASHQVRRLQPDHPDAGTAPMRQTRAERRAAEEQRRAAEADLARLLDEQETARLEEAADAARRHAEEAAKADEVARLLRRNQPLGRSTSGSQE